MKRSVLSLLLFIGCLDLQAGRSSRRPAVGKASLIGSLLIGASRAQQCQFDQQRADKIVQEDFNNTLVRSAAPVSAILDQFDLCAWFKKDSTERVFCEDIYNMILLPFQSVFYNSIHDKDGKPFAACVTDEDNPTGEMFVYCASPEEEAVTTSVIIDRMKLRGFWEFSRTSNSSVSDAQLLYAQYAGQYQNNRLTDLEKALLKHLEEKKDLSKK